MFVCALVSCLLAMVAPLSATTAMQTYVEAMQPGWNLGNTLDATSSETAWGNPLVTQAFIQQIKAQGFKSIRIPITWDTGNRVGPAPSYTIDPAWLDRVQQIVDWSLDAGLYVMINMHHDSTWVRTMPANHDAVLAKFNAIWSQVAPRFRDYPNTLMFESINEPTFDGVDSATKNALLKELNVSFFTLVRGTGGGNATRPLVLPSVETNSGQEFLDSLSQTIAQLNDPNLIATVHDYGYWPFSVNITGVTTFEGTAKDFTTAGIDRVYNTLVSQGIPVVVGEFGLLSFGGFGGAVEDGEALKFFEYLTSYYRSKGITYQWWDAGNFLNRYTGQWNTPDLYGYIMHSVVGRSSTGATDLIFVNDGAPVDTVVPLNLNGNSFVSLTNGATTLTPGIDYTIAGDVLTVKAGVLAAYASGAYGEKTVLMANFNAGMPWKLHVRHQAPPVLGAVSGTKSGGIVIPTAFNGDLLATMEARYVAAPNYPYPGAASWTPFQGYNDAYLPDYANNRIVIKKEFFAATTNDAVELTFYFWSGKKESYRLTFQPAGNTGGTPQELVIYDDAFSYGWGNWSWAATNDASTEVVHSGTTSIAVDENPWTGVMLGNWAGPLNRSDYRTLTFWANGGTVGGQQLTVGAVVNWNGTGSTIITNPLPANTWTKIEVPLDSLGVTDSSQITGLTFANNSNTTLPRYYLDDFHLTTDYASWIVFVNGAPAPVITSPTAAVGTFNASFSYSTTATNNPTLFSATDLPPGLTIDPNTGIISGTPTAAGSYVVTLVATGANGAGTETLTIDIAPAPVGFTLAGGGSFSAAIFATYNGDSQPIQITTNPPGVPVLVTYNGSTTPPVLPGTYDIVVTPADANHAGIAQGTLVITVTALVRHAPAINGMLNGSLQFLTSESFAVNGDGTVSGDLLAPGLPAVRLNGHPTFAGIVDAAGAPAPANYSVTLNGEAVVRHVMLRVDPIAMPMVTVPTKPAGTRVVTLNKPSQSVGSFSTLRDLTLNGEAGVVAIPPGVYGQIVVNGDSSITLGVAGATEAAVYELQGLTLNGHASVTVLGPVKLKLASGTVVNGAVGSAAHPEWLDWSIAAGGLSLNGDATVCAIVTAPNGTVTLDGRLHGRVVADRLTINGDGILDEPGR